MNNRIVQTQLKLLADTRNYAKLSKLLETMHAVDIAPFFNDLAPDVTGVVFRTLNKQLSADIFVELDFDVQQRLLEAINNEEVAALFDLLAVDDAVDILEEMPESLSQRVLLNVTSSTRQLLNEYLRYDADSVGSLMTAEFTAFPPTMTAAEAVKHIRTNGQRKETIYTCYVVDTSFELLGAVAIRSLLTAPDDSLVSELMSTNVISAKTSDTRESASVLLRKYDFIALPVVDNENHLVGIVTVDDAADVLREEATEDMERMAGMKPSEKPYLKTSVMALAQNRFFWLLVLMFSGMISEMIVGKFETGISAIPLLVAFIPMLSDMGGDAGSQVSTLVVRSMALGEVSKRDTLRIAYKEVFVSLLVGIPLGILNFLRVFLIHGEPMVALTISLALLCTILLANIFGAVLPALARLIKVDPALMATPMIASIVDILSMMIYFGLAIVLLHI